MPGSSWPEITTQEDYDRFQALFARFQARWQIIAPSGHIVTNYTTSLCEVCERDVAGSREQLDMANPSDNHSAVLKACQDCIYYAAYGRLDDTTMLTIELNEGAE